MSADCGLRDPQLGAAHNFTRMLLHSLKDKIQLQEFMEHVAYKVRLVTTCWTHQQLQRRMCAKVFQASPNAMRVHDSQYKCRFV